MDWIKKHADTVMILGTLAGLFFWIDGKFERIDARFSVIERDIASIQKELAIVKTVLMMKEILPRELAVHHVEDK